MKQVELVPIDRSGGLAKPITTLPQMVRKNSKATASFYKATGFTPPWIGYVVVCDGLVVGGGGFKGPPRDHKVEIAYYTLPEFEGRGFATAAARELVRIARTAEPEITIFAQTLPQPNASNALLKKLGFTFNGTIDHPEDGEVWEWQLPNEHHPEGSHYL